MRKEGCDDLGSWRIEEDNDDIEVHGELKMVMIGSQRIENDYVYNKTGRRLRI